MTDPNQSFQAPPTPSLHDSPPVARPTKLRTAGIAFFAIGCLLVVAGILKLPDGYTTGATFAFFGILLFAFSFIPLPPASDSEVPLSPIERLTGIFYEPSRIFRSLRSHPYWLAAFLTVGIVNAAYLTVFVQRLTPDRIVDYTFDKLADSPLRPPPDRMAAAKEQALDQQKNPVRRIQTIARSFVGIFVLLAFLGALYMVVVLAFGGRINFWQSMATIAYAFVPIAIISKGISLIILFIKSPDDIHPLIGQETLLQDNLGVLFAPADHPTLFALFSAIGVLSFYGLWLKGTGLKEAGTRVSSSAAWGAAITLWILGTIFFVIISTLFSSFIS